MCKQDFLEIDYSYSVIILKLIVLEIWNWKFSKKHYCADLTKVTVFYNYVQQSVLKKNLKNPYSRFFPSN